MKISVIGAGAFGTAMASVAARCENEVLLWAHDPRVAETIAATRSNPLYLPHVPVPENVRATSEGLLKLRPNERPFVLTRAAYAGTQRYAATSAA